MSHKSWMYTINNYKDDDITRLKSLEVPRHRCCKEVGDSGTPHLQGVITFSRGYRLAGLKKLFPTGHFEPTKSVDAVNYCIKGEIIIDLTNNNQGHRTDLDEAIAIATNSGLVAMAKAHPSTFVKYHKGIKELLFTLDEPKEWTNVTVIVLWGAPGSGKSRLAREIDPKLYNVPEPINGTIWFDGYRGQKTILLDDFYGWLKYHTLLQITDGYPMMLPVKGAFVNKQWDTVIITSNKPPEEWYPNVDNIDALKRRISSVQNVTVTEVGGNTMPPLLDEID
ncbi:Rep [uncultured virus]|uniref:ATP-dependent helicase Rep n=1 Tax=uncultured virus TaxID=340016 RepID=A0A2K9LWI7_9VIRU|nr:Rep [uncultured virus]